MIIRVLGPRGGKNIRWRSPVKERGNVGTTWGTPRSISSSPLRILGGGGKSQLFEVALGSNREMFATTLALGRALVRFIILHLRICMWCICLMVCRFVASSVCGGCRDTGLVEEVTKSNVK